MRSVILLYLVCAVFPVAAQFAPQAGVAGSTAISRDDNRFVAWAATCTVERGWQDIADQSLGKASLGTDNNAVGKSDNSIVSLGDGGTAILTFPAALYNGPGADFAVFENGFPNPSNAEEAFLELAFVEVSSDGVHYVRFPATSATDTPQVPMAGVYMNARKINNLAGKYMVTYGTPFDLDELKDSSGIDVNHITHIRLVDVVGSIGANGTTDKDGHFINDPYPSPVSSSGFDLDAVGAIHIPGWWPSGVRTIEDHSVQVSPNPCTDQLAVTANQKLATVVVTDATGRQLLAAEPHGKFAALDVTNFVPGTYFLTITAENGTQWTERFGKY